MPDIAVRRLHAQRLTGPPFASAVDAVAWLGAVQSQDYASAKWALGQRTQGATDADLDRLFDAGAILRTHVLRPTWHFALPDDFRWLQDLTGPRLARTISPATAAKSATTTPAASAYQPAPGPAARRRATGVGPAASGLRSTSEPSHRPAGQGHREAGT